MLSVYSLDEPNKWDQVVKSFSHYDVYYLSCYSKAFKIHGDGEPMLFYYENEDFRAMNVVMKRDIARDKNFSGKIPENIYFDLSTPYGYGGFWLEGHKKEDHLKKLSEEYSSFCENNGYLSEIVRFHPILENYKEVHFLYDVVTLGKTVTMELVSPECIWDNLSSKNRNVIRKAIKSGIEIYWGRNWDLYNKFIGLYNATMDKDNAKLYYYFSKDFFDSVLNDLKYNSLIFYAAYEGKIIAMSIIMFCNGQMHYHLSASAQEFQHLAPTNLLLYEVACWGSVNGYTTFHLGGGLGGKEDSLFKFKKAFSKSGDTMFVIGKRIFNQEKYNKLVEIRAKEDNFDKDTSFFPIYRA